MAVKKLTCLFSATNFLFFLSLYTVCLHVSVKSEDDTKTHHEDNFETYWPTVMIATLVRNKEHTLPYFFGHLEKLDYPKDRIALWLKSDHNMDNSTAKVKEWITANENLYNSVEFSFEDKEFAYPGQKGPCDWPPERFKNVIQLRENALNAARLLWADYLFMLDADVMITNPDTLKILVSQKKTIVAPMMDAGVGHTYSNFWGGMDDEGYYKRVPEYFDIVERNTTGLFKVPMVHTVLLVDLRHKITEKLSYLPQEGYSKAEDDIIIFAISAMQAGIDMYVLNTEQYGYIMVPLDDYHTLAVEREQFLDLQIRALDDANPEMGPNVDYIIEDRGLYPSPHIHRPGLPVKDRLDFEQVYMINLERRPERRKRMLYVFDLLGIEAVSNFAVDGKNINASFIHKMGIQILPGFADPVKGRPMTIGEIGCFLSHYFIWKDVVEKGYQSVVVFEDDLKFEPYFRTKLQNIMYRVAQQVPDWDLIYLGRKRLNRADEAFLEGSQSLVWPSYSYWTLSYLLSLRGAQKLLAQEPLQHLLPVDEYLPVMFDKHPEESWKEPFSPRDLKALSAEPLLIYPTHYLGEAHYISDTEYSELISGSGNNHNSPEKPQLSPDGQQDDPDVGIHAGLPGQSLEHHNKAEKDILHDEL